MIDVTLVKNALPQILSSALITLQITFGAFAIGCVFGLALGLMHSRGNLLSRSFVNAYSTFLRGTPMLVQIGFFYYLLPAIGLHISAMSAAIVAIGLNSSAYMSQVIRVGVNGVSKDEIDAAKVLGFSRFQTARFIILPQAIHSSLPSITSECITLLKDSSLAASIGVAELYKHLKSMLSETYDVTTVFFLLFASYLTMTGALSLIFYFIKKRMGHD